MFKAKQAKSKISQAIRAREQMLAQQVTTIDYRQTNAAHLLLPKQSILASPNWSDLHLEVYQQPKFEIAEHQHTMHVIACGSPHSALEGSGERWLDGKLERERRQSGDIALIPAGIAHRCNWNTSVEFMVLAIEPTLLQQVGQDWVNPDRIELLPRFMNQADGFIQNLILRLREEAEGGGMGSDLLVDSLKTALAIHLLRQYCTTRPKRCHDAGGLSQTQLGLVADYINDNLQESLKLGEIAAIAQLSPYHFLRLFKQRVGITPYQYILQCRIEKAKSLLQQSELTLAEIAVRVGFCDQSHLTRSFKRFVGITPKQMLQSQSRSLLQTES